MSIDTAGTGASPRVESGEVTSAVPSDDAGEDGAEGPLGERTQQFAAWVGITPGARPCSDEPCMGHPSPAQQIIGAADEAT
jgi:hypothetical protein